MPGKCTIGWLNERGFDMKTVKKTLSAQQISNLLAGGEIVIAD